MQRQATQIPSSDAYRVYSVVGDRYTFLLTAEHTEGAYAVFEFFVPPGSGSPPHVHHREDEAFYVVDGEFEFTVAGQPLRVSAGQSVFGRRGVPHNFKNVGSIPGRMIVTITPAGLEEFFAEVGTPLRSREDAPAVPSPEDIRRLKEAGPKYGLELL
jgi:mannose-6-phosphate isomerase-like protein (cupin superfamily)